MTRHKHSQSFIRASWRAGPTLVLILVLLLLTAACTSASSSDTVPAGTQPTTAATTAPSTTSTSVVDDAAADAASPFDLSIGLIGGMTTENHWEYVEDPESHAESGFVLAPMIPTLYAESFPNLTLVPYAAAEVSPEVGEESGEQWVIDVSMRPDLQWSDGEAMDANDVEFTANVVQALGLQGDYLGHFPFALEDDPETTDVDETAGGLIAVEAMDDLTVRYRWTRQPTLGEWHFGVALAPIFPEHFWAPVASGVTTAEELYGAPATGAPSGGPTTVTSLEPDGSVTAAANPHYHPAGGRVTAYTTGGLSFVHDTADRGYEVGDLSGEVLAEWVEGPFAQTITYRFYESDQAAVEAIDRGDVALILSAEGLGQSAERFAQSAPTVDVVRNELPAFRYVGFNTRRFPGNDASFRQAVACLIDRSYLAENVMGGAVAPAHTVIPVANRFWSNAGLSPWCDGQTLEQRVASAVEILRDGGWTWEVEPVWDGTNLDVIPQGSGLRGPDGALVEALQLFAPGPGFDVVRTTYALFLEEWASDIGVPVQAELTGFSRLVDTVFLTTEWDLYLLGWEAPTYPAYVESLFTSRNDSAEDGFNLPGYSNSAYDELGERFVAATSASEAATIGREMEAILSEDVPYIVLFAPTIAEALGRGISLPRVPVLGGFQSFPGIPSLIQPAS